MFKNSYDRASALECTFANAGKVNTSDLRLHIKSQEQIHGGGGAAWAGMTSIMSTEV